MKIKTALAALIVPLALVMSACGPQQGCYDDGERVSCDYEDDDDDREYDDDDEDWGDDD